MTLNIIFAMAMTCIWCISNLALIYAVVIRDGLMEFIAIVVWCVCTMIMCFHP